MEKKKYITPRIEWIPLDNEISLALESAPPAGPGEVNNSIIAPERFGSQPVRDFIG